MAEGSVSGFLNMKGLEEMGIANFLVGGPDFQQVRQYYFQPIQTPSLIVLAFLAADPSEESAWNLASHTSRCVELHVPDLPMLSLAHIYYCGFGN